METVDLVQLQLKATMIHPSGCWEPNSGTPQEQYAPLIEPSLWFLFRIFYSNLWNQLNSTWGFFQRALSVSRQCSFTDESAREGELKSVICTRYQLLHEESRACIPLSQCHPNMRFNYPDSSCAPSK